MVSFPYIGFDNERLRAITASYYNCILRFDESIGDLMANTGAGGHGNLMPLFIPEMQERGYLVNSTLYLMHAHQASHISAFMESFEASLMTLNQRVASGSAEAYHAKPGQDKGFARLA